jgi:16S rRNA (cytosine967-C5)-methyltransferase
MPTWICQKWSEDYGEDEAEEILSAINVNPPITLRVNTLKTTRDELIERLRSKGIEAEKTSLSDSGIKLTKSVAVSELDVLGEGLCYVQDEASQLCVSALGARPGETVIDTCSCPGGKSFGIAMDMGNEGRLISLDLHESKLSLVKNGAEKLGISIIDASVHNGSSPKDELIGKADRVLTDAPCSGLGVIAKKPDLRYKSFEDISKLPEIQYKILCASSKYVKSGGTLVYSTCTLNKDENEMVAKRFLEENKDFSPNSEGMPFGESMVTLFPSEHGTDGFFIAKFIKE